MSEIETLWHGFLQVKGRFPAASVDAIGQRAFDTPQYYLKRDVPSIVHIWDQPITEAEQQRQNRWTTWLNEAYVIRLRALVEESKIGDRNSARLEIVDAFGEEARELVCLLWTLRHRFAHGSGGYGHLPEDGAIASKLLDMFWDASDARRPSLETLEEWPLDIDKVLEPLTKKILCYLDQIAHGAGGN